MIDDDVSAGAGLQMKKAHKLNRNGKDSTVIKDIAINRDVIQNNGNIER